MPSEELPHISQPESAPPDDMEDSPSSGKKNVWDRLDDQIK